MRSFVLNRARAANYPGQFQELRDMIGEEKTAILVQYIGGVRLYIPSSLHTKHALIAWLGADVAQQVCAEFGGLSVEIPRLEALRRADRNAQIISDMEAGLSQRNAALKYHMTERNIRNIVKTTKKGDSNES